MNDMVRKWFDEHSTAINVSTAVLLLSLVLSVLAPGLFSKETAYVINLIVTALFLVALGAFFWSMYGALKNVPVEKAPAWRLPLLVLLLAVALGSIWWVPFVFGKLFHYYGP
jgi:hypothetical protein